MGSEGSLLNPTKDSCPACPDLVGVEHRETAEGSDLVGKDLTSHPISNENALYFAASNSRIITRSTSSGRGSGSFSTNPPPLTALNSTLLPSRNKCAARTGWDIPPRAST